jgi:SAM-dependent methyltransferase
LPQLYGIFIPCCGENLFADRENFIGVRRLRRDSQLFIDCNMNSFENWFCASSLWRYVTRQKLLPWLLANCELGEHVLEIGAGPGAATPELLRRAARVTSLDYEQRFAASLAARHKDANSSALRGDASSLPFADKTFSATIAILALHHLYSIESQDHAFAEIYRVLRPGGIFVAFEIADSWMHRVGHIRSTFVPVRPESVSSRLSAAGFTRISVEFQRVGFRIRATRSPA